MAALQNIGQFTIAVSGNNTLGIYLDIANANSINITGPIDQ